MRRPASASLRPGPKEWAEGGLRRNPYQAPRNLSCECREGVLVLRVCLPSYYLKQVAQEVVAPLAGAARIDNQIQVLTATFRPPQG